MKKMLLVLALVVIVIGVFLIPYGADELQAGEVRQQGSIEISNSLNYKHNILYVDEFNSLPRVKIELVKGSGYLEIIEQRTDGFIFKSSNLGYSVAEGAHVEWAATGFME